MALKIVSGGAPPHPALAPRVEDYLRERGLSLELVDEKYGIRLLAATTIYKRLGWEEGAIRHLGGLWIPQMQPNGEPYPRSGQAILFPIHGGKPDKYNTRGLNHPSFIGQWGSLEQGQLVVVCESVIKAIVVHEVTMLPTVGLNGVEGWSQGLSRPHADMMDQRIWGNLRAIVLYDSLSTINKKSADNVSRARQSCEYTISGFGGATILQCELPKIPKSEDWPKGQWGVDDFVVTHGGEALVDLLKEAQEVDEEETNQQTRIVNVMNSMYAVLHVPSRIAIRGRPGTLLSKADLALWFHNHRVRVGGMRRGQPIVTSMPASEMWLQHPERLSLQGLVFQPGAEALVDDNLNLWTGFGCEPAQSAGRAEEYWYNVGVDALGEESMETLCHWFAGQVQRPDRKSGWYLYLAGKQGTGKNYLVEPLKGIFGRHLVQTSVESYTNKFNSAFSGARMILFSEMSERMDTRLLHVFEQELKLEADTAPQQRMVEPKGAERVFINRNAAVIMLSNYTPAWTVTRGDRRGLYLSMGEHMRLVDNGGRKKDVYWDRRWAWMSAMGAPEVFRFLLSWKVNWKLLGGPPPKTDYKVRLYGAASITDMSVVLEDYLAGEFDDVPDVCFIRSVDLIRLAHGAHTELVTDRGTLISAGKILQVCPMLTYQRSRIGASKELTRLYLLPKKQADKQALAESFSKWADYWGR